MPEGTYTTVTGERVTVTRTDKGAHVIHYADGRTVIV